MKGRESPNHDERPPGTPVDMLVLHYTGMTSAAAALDRLCDPASRVSSHYVVEEDGQVWSLVPEGRRAWHAGISYWRGHRALNDRSVGIEIVNPGHEWGYRPFPALQMAAVCDLCLEVLGRHPIPPRNVVGHSDIAPDRKQDPGELFDWVGLAKNGVGLWPALLPLPLGEGRGEGVLCANDNTVLVAESSLTLPSPKGRGFKAADALTLIGYDPAAGVETNLRAFDLHWGAARLAALAATL